MERDQLRDHAHDAVERGEIGLVTGDEYFAIREFGDGQDRQKLGAERRARCRRTGYLGAKQVVPSENPCVAIFLGFAE